MALISQQTLEQIRNANDIVDVVGLHVQLKRAGSTFKGLCPFHKEKSPSFNVTPARQMYYCFGCHKGGDVFRFVMDYENVDFMTAARMLAERGGVHLELEEGASHEKGENKDTLFKLNDKLAAFYQRVLLDHSSAAAARAYLEDRKLTRDVIDMFGIGFAPEHPDTLPMWARKNGFTIDQMEAAGLLMRSEHDADDLYDRFRGRLMFPIRDEQGRVVGFSGRVLRKEQHPAKYVNTPETMLFKKGRILYALDRARKAMTESRAAIICEGQIDVIRCHSVGIDNAVAGLGTAITEDHARLLKRYADAVILVMDSDNAGQNSAIRSAPVLAFSLLKDAPPPDKLIQSGLSVRVARLPAGEDPDSLILKHGAEAMRAVIAENKSLLDFQIDILTAREDMKSDTGFKRVTTALLEIVAKSPSAAQREQMIQHAAERLGVSPSALHEDMRRAARSAPAQRAEAAPVIDKAPEHPREEVELARLLVQHPAIASLVSAYIKTDILEDDACRTIVGEVLAHGHEPDWNLAGALTNADPECQRLAAGMVAADANMLSGEAGPDRAAQDFILLIHRKALQRRRRALEQRRAAAKGEEHARLDMELKQLILDLKHLQMGWEKAAPLLAMQMET